MKKLIAILPFLCILSSEISSAGVVYEGGSSTPQYACELSKSYSTDDSIIRVRPFYLDIIPPSSGVQFYRNGIIFLSYTKVEEKVPDKHLSFGALKTYMALVIGYRARRLHAISAFLIKNISERGHYIYRGFQHNVYEPHTGQR